MTKPQAAQLGQQSKSGNVFLSQGSGKPVPPFSPQTSFSSDPLDLRRAHEDEVRAVLYDTIAKMSFAPAKGAAKGRKQGQFQ